MKRNRRLVSMSREESYFKRGGYLRRGFQDLSHLYGRPELLRIFAVANYLHQNFYENAMTLDEVRASAEAAKQFIQKVEKLLG